MQSRGTGFQVHARLLGVGPLSGRAKSSCFHGGLFLPLSEAIFTLFHFSQRSSRASNFSHRRKSSARLKFGVHAAVPISASTTNAMSSSGSSQPHPRVGNLLHTCGLDFVPQRRVEAQEPDKNCPPGHDSLDLTARNRHVPGRCSARMQPRVLPMFVMFRSFTDSKSRSMK